MALSLGGHAWANDKLEGIAEPEVNRWKIVMAFAGVAEHFMAFSTHEEWIWDTCITTSYHKIACYVGFD